MKIRSLYKVLIESNSKDIYNKYPEGIKLISNEVWDEESNKWYEIGGTEHLYEPR